MKNSCKIDKLVDRLQRFSSQLEKLKDFTVHRHVNHFFYMQKKTELIALVEQFTETQERLSVLTSLIEKEYMAVASQWIHDVRWLHCYQMAEKKCASDGC